MKRARILVSLLWLAMVGPVHAAPGDLVWQDVLDRADGFGWSLDLIVKGPRLFVAGVDTNGAGNSDLVVRAYTAKSGALLWEQVVDEFGDTDSAGGGLVVQGRRLLVAGASYPLGGVQDWHVRAHDAKSGALLWNEVLDTAGGRDIPMGLAVKGKTLVVVGRAESGAGDDDARVRAYDVRSGQVLWNDLVDEAGADDEAERVVIKGQAAIVAGWVTTGGGHTDVFFRAYDLTTGALRWDQRFDASGRDDRPVGMVLEGKRMLVTIRSTGGGFTGSQLQARDAKTGAVAWSQSVDAGGDQAGASNLVVKGSRVCSSAWAGPTFADSDWLVMCHHVKTGALLWDDRYDGGAQEIGSVATVAGRTLVVAGGSADGFGARDYHVRAYDTVAGSLRWEDRVPGAGDDSATSGATKGKLVFVGGFIEDPVGDKNWVVRAYSTK